MPHYYVMPAAYDGRAAMWRGWRTLCDAQKQQRPHGYQVVASHRHGRLNYLPRPFVTMGTSVSALPTTWPPWRSKYGRGLDAHGDFKSSRIGMVRETCAMRVGAAVGGSGIGLH
jgi:hypothetical protein